MSKKGIDRLIVRYVFEILCLTLIIVVTYGLFSHNNLSAAAVIAKDYTENGTSMQLMYNSVENKTEDTVDNGELLVRNPNRFTEKVDIYMVFNDIDEIDKLNIYFDNDKISSDNGIIRENGYAILVKSVKIDPYKQYTGKVSIEGNVKANTELSYNFEVQESF